MAADVTPIPDALQDALEAICDRLRTLVDGYGEAPELKRLEGASLPLVDQLVAAGCAGQAALLTEAVGYMRKAVDLWGNHCAKPTSASHLAYHDDLFQAYDRACSAILLELEDDRPLPDGIEVIDLQAAA